MRLELAFALRATNVSLRYAVRLGSFYQPPDPSPSVHNPSTYYTYNFDHQLTHIIRPQTADNDPTTITFDYYPETGQLHTQTTPESEC